MFNEALVKRIKTNYDLEKAQAILEVMNHLDAIDEWHVIFDQNFVAHICDSIFLNKLDYKSVVVALYYVLVKNNAEQNIDFLKTDDEIYGMLKSLLSLDKINISTKKDQLDTIKNMFIAIAKDVRVIIVRLCIEQEKLNYLGAMQDSEIEDFMKSCNDLYAPVSAMLGMSQIKNNFENATFKYYKPKLYTELTQALEDYVEERNDNIQMVIKKIRHEISPLVNKCEVYGRQKQLASIAKKLIKKNMNVDTIKEIYGRNNNLEVIAKDANFSEITLSHILDVLAVRVIVETVDECYAVLGKIFSIFKPFGNYKDYISNPKKNGYQSLHTAIILDNGDPVEVQIRTFEMHNYAEYGFAAHWAFKSNKKVTESDAKINYIRSILELYKEKTSDELLDILKTDVYGGKIFVQSPMGKVMEFPEGATTIDFAYAIHSAIGDKCVGAKINGKMVPLSTMLNNGDVVEIITNPSCKGPSRDWLKIAKSSATKNKINSFFKKQMKDENIKKGKSMLEAQIKLKGLSMSRLLKDEFLQELFDRYSFSNLDDMYASIGYGGINTTQVLNKLVRLYDDYRAEHMQSEREFSTDSKTPAISTGKVLVRGYSNMLVKFAKCCNPIPGDEIVGYVSRGKGVTIHREDCSAMGQYEFDRLIECEWNKDDKSSFVASICVIVGNQTGTLSKISKKINDSKINIVGIHSKNINNDKALINLSLQINSKEELDSIMNKINVFSFVYEVYRDK